MNVIYAYKYVYIHGEIKMSVATTKTTNLHIMISCSSINATHLGIHKIQGKPKCRVFEYEVDRTLDH